jgi:hypothetical protein
MKPTFLLILLASAAGLTAPAAADACDETCTASYKKDTTGSKANLPPGAIFTVMSTTLTDGTGEWKSRTSPGGEGQVSFCDPCTKCKGSLIFAFNEPSLCVAYNLCGALDQGPFGGSVSTLLKGRCGDNGLGDGAGNGDNVDFQMGTCDPNFTGHNCASNPPVQQPPTYSETWWIECGACI